MRVLAATALFATLAAAGAAHATSYDLAGMFGSTNPAGPWTYGYYTSAGLSGFTAYPSFGAGGIQTWTDPSLPQTAIYGTPDVAHNTTTGYLTFGTVTFAPGQASFHPGQQGQASAYVFTAPSAGTYGISAAFGGLDYVGPTDTAVAILTPAATLFSAMVDGYQGDPGQASFGPSPTQAYTGSVALSAGEQLVFEVAFDPAGTRGSGPFYYDTTGIEATLTTTPVPEPAGLAVLGAGLLGFGLVRRRA